jgi:hypothetical protein
MRPGKNEKTSEKKPQTKEYSLIPKYLYIVTGDLNKMTFLFEALN